MTGCPPPQKGGLGEPRPWLSLETPVLRAWLWCTGGSPAAAIGSSPALSRFLTRRPGRRVSRNHSKPGENPHFCLELGTRVVLPEMSEGATRVPQDSRGSRVPSRPSRSRVLRSSFLTRPSALWTEACHTRAGARRPRKVHCDPWAMAPRVGGMGLARPPRHPGDRGHRAQGGQEWPVRPSSQPPKGGSAKCQPLPWALHCLLS